MGEHDGLSPGSKPLLEVPSPLISIVVFAKLSLLIKWSASIFECSEDLRRPFRTEAERGGLDFERRLLLMLPEPPLPEDATTFDSS